MSTLARRPQPPRSEVGRAARHGLPTRRRDARWCLIASIILLAAIAVLGPGGTFSCGGVGGQGWLVAETSVPTPPESVGASGPRHDPIALTGARGITIVAGAPEGRQRASLEVEPGAQSPIGRDRGHGDGPSIVAARPALLVAGGLFAVRAPPAVRA